MRTSIDRILFALAIAATHGCADPDPVEAPPAPPGQSGLQVELRMQSPAFASNEAVIAEVTIVNADETAAQLLTWYLPSSELQESVFAVTRDGQPVAFIGPHYKRAQAEQEDFLELAPGARTSWQIDLSGFYDFSRTGDYTIQVTLDDAKLRGSSGVLTSPASTVWVEGRVPGQVARKPTRGACSATEQALIANAISVAGGYSNAARDYLNGPASATPRYTTWFGAFSSSGWNTARTHFIAIADAFATKPITIDCGCNQKNVYAYVFPNQPYKIFVCGAFWLAPTSGTDSKAGTLVHETSHFDVVATTDDWAYGQTACRSLALSDPTKALDNADSHEYFAENTPAQP